jgi:hypothetical protein
MGGVLGDTWLIVSMIRTAVAAAMLNLLWAIVVVLMIYRPGSTTGVGL